MKISLQKIAEKNQKSEIIQKNIYIFFFSEQSNTTSNILRL